MSWLLPLTVALPFAGAGFGVALDHWMPGWVKQFPALIFAVATTVCAVLALTHSGSAPVHWVGGWQPKHGIAIGIAFVGEPLGAGMAAFAGLLATAALLFSWHYMEEAPRLYRVLMLVFLGGMCGFALSGDLFNMFVFFEVMGVAAYALAGYHIEELGPLQGALNFAITNSIGAYMVLFGTALVYGETGALNLAQIGKTLDGHPPDALLVVAFTLILVGFLVKAAVVPFHLWLADAHAVAPAPVCVLFSGVMVELGLLGVARVYWTVFEAPFGPHAADVRNVLLVVGIVTALLGASMAFLQRHLKRLLAYSTISHAGVMLAGIALLDHVSLAGVANLVLSHGLLKGALFLAAGILLKEYSSVDELRLHGRGRELPGCIRPRRFSVHRNLSRSYAHRRRRDRARTVVAAAGADGRKRRLERRNHARGRTRLSRLGPETRSASRAGARRRCARGTREPSVDAGGDCGRDEHGRGTLSLC